MSDWAWTSCPANAGFAPSAGIELLIVINADFDRWHHQCCMNTPNRAILIGEVVAAAVIAGVVTLLLYEKQDYRDCVAQMWDRKHPAEVT